MLDETETVAEPVSFIYVSAQLVSHSIVLKLPMSLTAQLSSAQRRDKRHKTKTVMRVVVGWERTV